MRKKFFFFSCFTFISCVTYQPISQPSATILNIENAAEYEKLGISDGIACATFVFGIPVSDNFSYHAAMHDAIDKLNGDFLIQTSTDIRYTIGMPFVYKRCLLVEGIIIKIINLQTRPRHTGIEDQNLTRRKRSDQEVYVPKTEEEQKLIDDFNDIVKKRKKQSEETDSNKKLEPDE